ncbi:MAG: MerC domain-containing protein [Chthonomonas sp.]|nr:MerC domain-containing protein [Chthonomonas sp.]
MKPTRSVNWDKVGGTASSLCAVHCILTGLAMGFISSFGLEFIASDALELAFFVIAILAGALAIRNGLRKHGDWRLAPLFVAGMGLLIVRHVFFGHPHAHADEGFHAVPPAATWMSVVGAICLIVFHVWNSLKSHRDCSCCQR